MMAQASGPHMPTQWRLVTRPATKAVAGELMAASSTGLTRGCERHFLDRVIPGDDEPGGPRGKLQRERSDEKEPELTFPFGAHARLFARPLLRGGGAPRVRGIPLCVRDETYRVHRAPAG